jgi:putative transposase
MTRISIDVDIDDVLYNLSDREKQKLVVAKLYEKITNQRKDFLHKLSTQIVNEYDSVAIENLNVSGMIKNKNLAKHIADVSWGTFESYLKYKADWYGKNILQIGRFEPSSKMCSCGKVNNQLKLSQREWVCVSCGTLHDRDILAANNIKKFGLGQTQTNVKVKH